MNNETGFEKITADEAYEAEKKLIAFRKQDNSRLLPKEAVDILHYVYGQIWTEACYDPATNGTMLFAQTLLDRMKRLNEILKFKE